MTNDVVLTAALRNNLLSLQNTQSKIDQTQQRLATGLKVASALDNPQSFFASEGLKNRASDLQRLLDGIGQNIQVIQAADNGVTALTRLVEQADSVAQSARDALAQGQQEAKIVGDEDLRGIDDLTTEVAGIGANSRIEFYVYDTDGDLLIDGSGANGRVDIAAGQSIEELVTSINDLNNASSLDDDALEASINTDGQLEIRTLNGQRLSINFIGDTTSADNDAANLSLADDLGFGDIAELTGDGTDNGGNLANDVRATIVPTALISSNALYRGGTTNIARASDTLESLSVVEGGAATGATGLIEEGALETDDEIIISINNDASSELRIAINDGTNPALTIQGLVDQINNDGTLSESIQASFDATTGRISFRAIADNVESIEFGVGQGAAGAATITTNFGFGAYGVVDSTNTPGTALAVSANANYEAVESIRVGAAAAELARLEGEFNNVRDQITELVSNGDTGYRGTNLLFGDDLTTFFNEFRSSSLITEGVTFTATGLGLDEANFANEVSVDGALSQVRGALESVRAFGSTLANDLSIIQTREDFTNNLINTLEEGSDKLVVADQNEEGAKLLALQTRQQLGVTSLSLASQSQQSVLRLF